MRHRNQITLRGLEPELQRELQAAARREGVSLNKAALRLLAKGAGLGQPKEVDRIGHTLDAWIGTWTKREAESLMDSIRSCEQIDADLWD